MANAQCQLSCTPQSGINIVNVTAVNTYIVNLGPSINASINTTFQEVDGIGVGPAPGDLDFSSQNIQPNAKVTLTTNATLFTSLWMVVGYDEWQTPAVNHDAPNISVQEILVDVL